MNTTDLIVGKCYTCGKPISKDELYTEMEDSELVLCEKCWAEYTRRSDALLEQMKKENGHEKDNDNAGSVVIVRTYEVDNPCGGRRLVEKTRKVFKNSDVDGIQEFLDERSTTCGYPWYNIRFEYIKL